MHGVVDLSIRHSSVNLLVQVHKRNWIVSEMQMHFIVWNGWHRTWINRCLTDCIHLRVIHTSIERTINGPNFRWITLFCRWCTVLSGNDLFLTLYRTFCAKLFTILVITYWVRSESVGLWLWKKETFQTGGTQFWRKVVTSKIHFCCKFAFPLRFVTMQKTNNFTKHQGE